MNHEQLMELIGDAEIVFHPDLDDLWSVAFVAFTEDQAMAQAERQIRPFVGRELTWRSHGGINGFACCWTNWGGRIGWPGRCEDGRTCHHIPKAYKSDNLIEIGWRGQREIRIRVVGLQYDGCDWDGEAMIPNWDIEILDPEVMLSCGTTVDTRIISTPWVDAPGIGTPWGFGKRAALVWPEGFVPNGRLAMAIASGRRRWSS